MTAIMILGIPLQKKHRFLENYLGFPPGHLSLPVVILHKSRESVCLRTYKFTKGQD